MNFTSQNSVVTMKSAVIGRARNRLLAGTALLGGALTSLAPNQALASCVATGTAGSQPVTITCGATTTDGSTLLTSPTASTNATTYNFTTDLTGILNGAINHTTGDGIVFQQSGAGTISVTNNVSVTSSNTAVLMKGNGGAISYGGNGSLSGTANAAGLDARNTSGAINIGTAITPVTATATGGWAYAVTTTSGGAVNAYLDGGAMTAIGLSNPNGMYIGTAGAIAVSVTGNTAITATGGGIGTATGIQLVGNTNASAAPITVTSNANIATNAAKFNRGVWVQQNSAQTRPVTVNLTGGTIYALTAGLQVNSAAGDVTIATGSGVVFGNPSATAAVNASISGASGNMSITTNGTVAGAIVGQNTNSGNSGTIAMHINGDVTALSGAAVTLGSVTGGTGAYSLDGTGNISGPSQGILANAGAGVSSLAIGGSGNTTASTAATGVAISASTLATGTGAITINRTGTVTGGSGASGYGIDVAQKGSGAATVSGVGNVTGGTGIRIVANTGNVTISPGGTVTGTSAGIVASTGGSGIMSITTLAGAAGNVSASAGSGIDATTNTGANNVTVTAGSTVTGTGAGKSGVVTSGSGTATITDLGTITGTGGAAAVTLNGPGSLLVGTGGTIGTVSGNIVVSLGTSSVQFNRSDAYTYADVISGSGSLQNAGAGTTILTGTNTYTGGTTISAGTLQLGNGGTTGSIVGNVTDNATLAFNRSNSYTFAGAISGTGAVQQLGSGTTILTGANTYSGTTTIAAGTLQVGSGGTAGALGSGNVVDNAALVVNRSDTLVLANTISGTGTLQQAGTGTTALTGTNTYSGNTTVTAGTLQIGNGGAAGSIASASVAVSSGATLAFNRTGSLTYGGVISGAGTVVKTGSGTVTLSGTDTYSGTTTVNAGTLAVTGALTNSNTTVNSTGTLTGAGSVKSVTVNNGGTLTPGSGAVPSAMTINGNLVFNAGSTYQVSVLPTNGVNTTANVSGTASLNGNLLVNVGAGVYTAGNSYTLLTATGGVSGTFAGANYLGSFGSNINTTITYNASTVVLSLATGTFQWKAIPGTSDWNTGTNWTSAAVPTSTDVAVFDTTTISTVDIKQNNTAVSALQFNAGAPAYTFNITGTVGNGASSLLIGGAGIQDGSSNPPTFVVSGSDATNTGTLQFKNASTAGGVTINTNAFGTTQFINTATGGTTVFNTAAGGTVDISGLTNGGMTAGSIAGAGNYVLGSNALTVGGLNTSTEVSGVISGTGGSLVKVGSGTLTLSGANTYTGGTTISAGTLQVGNGGASGTLGTGNVTNNATLAFNRSDSLTYAGVISGTGAVQQNGAGTTILSGTNTYTGGTTISAGTLQLGSGAGGSATGSIVGDVTNNGTFVINRSNAYTFDGVISGTGAVQQLGAGTTILTGANTYTGGTTISAGTLQFGNGGTTGSIVGSITDNGTLAVNRSDTVSLGGAIIGTGSFSQLGTGTTVFTGTNAYSGGTTISAGTLQLGSGGTTGSITGDVTNNSFLAINRSNAYTFAGAISGTGALQQLGSGTTTLTNTNTYSGGTTISSGTLQLGSGGTTGSITGDVTNNSNLAINRSNAYTYAGAITGTGALQQLGSGTTTLTGASSYTGGTTISAGALQLGSGAGGGATGAIDGPIVNNAALIVNRSNAITLSGDISGTGALQQTGTGITTLTGTSSFTGGTTISAGTLQIGNGGTSGSLAGTIVNNANLAFNRSDSLTYAGALSGTGAVQQNGTGTTIFTGTNTYTGGTTIAAGTLQLGAGTASGSVAGDVVNNSNFAVNRTDNYTYAGVISGTGAFQQNGTGTTTLSGISTYTGATTVNGGTLSVVGDISSSSGLTVNSGATLAGTGKVAATSLNFGGTLAPGSATTVGSLNVVGALAFAGGSIYQVKTSASQGTDFVNASGAVTVASGAILNAVDLGGFIKPNQTKTVLTSGTGVAGSFNLTTQGFFGGAKVTLTQDANNVYLNLTSFSPANIPVALPPTTLSVVLPSTTSTNQNNVVNVLNNIIQNGGTVPAAFNGMSYQPADTVSSMLNQLTGEIGTGGSQVGIKLTNSFLPLLLNPFVDGRRGFGAVGGTGLGFAAEPSPLPPEIALAYAAAMPTKAPQSAYYNPATFERRWNAWGALYGANSKTAGDSVVVGSHDTSSRAGGIATGFDYRLTPNTVIGFAIAGGNTAYGLSEGLGSGKSDVFQAGVYASHRFGAAYVSAALAYALHNMSTDRYVSISGTDRLAASFSAYNYGGRVETGYRFATPVVGITPYTALQIQTFRTPSYAESAISGSSVFALTYDARTTTATRVELGTWFDKSFQLDNRAILVLNSRAAWAHDHTSNSAINAAFQSLPASTFTVNGATAVPNAFLTTAGAEIRLPSGYALGLKFDGEFSSRSQSYAGTGTFRYIW